MTDTDQSTDTLEETTNAADRVTWFKKQTGANGCFAINELYRSGVRVLWEVGNVEAYNYVCLYGADEDTYSEFPCGVPDIESDITTVAAIRRVRREMYGREVWKKPESKWIPAAYLEEKKATDKK